MNKPQETERTIGGMRCVNKEIAADMAGMKISAFNKFLALQRAGRVKVKLKFYQSTKGAPIWFPVEFIESFVLQVMEKGGAY